MRRIKFSPSLIFPIIIILIAFFLNIFQFRLLISSFKIHSKGYRVSIIRLIPDIEKESLLTKTARVDLKYRIFEDSGYTLSFFIKTANQNQKEIPLFYSTDKHLSSTYWNISLVDGKIEAARIEHIPPIITDQRINNNEWHHILVTTNYNEERIYIDNKLSKNTLVNYLKTPDKWFVADVNPKLVGDEQINLKNFIFINKDLTPRQFTIYQDYFQGNNSPLYRLIFLSFISNFLIITVLYIFLVFIIKINYPKETFSSTIRFLSPKLILFLLAVISLWTNYGYQISLFFFFVFFYFTLKRYEHIFPAFLRTFINTPIYYFLTLLKFLRHFKIKGFFQYVISQKPEVYFCLFLFLGLLLSFNKLLFTNNLFR